MYWGSSVYNDTSDTGIVGIYGDTLSTNYPTMTVTIGQSFYQSYAQWPGVKFINDFNQAYRGSFGATNLSSTVGPACRALPDDNLLYRECGDEEDIYPTSLRPVRGMNYSEDE